MTPQAQQIAIAKFCGVDFSYALPNYLGDLNAMHAAEEKLNGNEYLEFSALLHVICDHSWRVSRIISASAPARAEAFLRALYLWKDA